MGDSDVELDDWQLSIYMSEIVAQADFARVAYNDLAFALSPQFEGVGTARQFASVQSLLSAAAMISKLLWFHQSRKANDPDILAFSTQRSRQLREILAVEDLPVLRARDVRNGFEHLDERLDAYLGKGARVLVDSNIGPKSAFMVNGKPSRHMRLIDPGAAMASVLDAEVNLNNLRKEIQEVATKAETWLAEWRQSSRDGGV